MKLRIKLRQRPSSRIKARITVESITVGNANDQQALMVRGSRPALSMYWLADDRRWTPLPSHFDGQRRPIRINLNRN
jgi:hypothetical protein